MSAPHPLPLSFQRHRADRCDPKWPRGKVVGLGLRLHKESPREGPLEAMELQGEDSSWALVMKDTTELSHKPLAGHTEATLFLWLTQGLGHEASPTWGLHLPREGLRPK